VRIKNLKMLLPKLVKNVSAQALFTLFFLSQIIACSSEDLAMSISDDANRGNSYSSQGYDTQGTTETTATSEISLSWAAPSQREDNEPISLSEIAGYKVYYGKARRKYTNSVTINDGTADGHTFRHFAAGTYFFALTTFDTEGRESQYSAEIKIIV
jgi:hypothetical protein